MGASKKYIGLLLAASVAAAYPAAASLETQEAPLPQEMETEAPLLPGETETEDELPEGLSVTAEVLAEEVLPLIAGTKLEKKLDPAEGETLSALQRLDPGQTKEALQSIIKLLENEDVRSLLQYEEVYDLLEALALKAGNFVLDEPELTVKILAELDVDEFYIYALIGLLEHDEAVRAVLEGVLGSEEAKEAGALMAKLARDETFMSQLDTALAVLQEEEDNG